MPASYFVIDTFTSTLFKGNPTGVFLISQQLSSDRMLSIAGELNFPVTAFIEKTGAAKNAYPIKYFTPTTEIPACGHATLASAKVIFSLTQSLPLLLTLLEGWQLGLDWMMT